MRRQVRLALLSGVIERPHYIHSSLCPAVVSDDGAKAPIVPSAVSLWPARAALPRLVPCEQLWHSWLNRVGLVAGRKRQPVGPEFDAGTRRKWPDRW